MEQQLLTNIRSIDCDVLDALASGRDLFGHRDRLQQLRIDISELRSQDRLSRPVAQAASSLARRIAAFANVIIKLQQDGDHVVNDLGTHLATVLQVTNEGGDKRRIRNPDSTSPSKRRCQRQKGGEPAIREEPSGIDLVTHLRHWFLDHLSNPYPSAEQKSVLAEAASCSRNKIESDLTNWRRRCGWTEMMHTYAGGKRELMAPLVERIESILADRNADDFDPQMEQRRIRKVATECGLSVKDMDEAVKAVERMKKYLTREEEERVGDWVHEIANLTGKKSLQAYVKPPVTPARAASVTARTRRRESAGDEEEADGDAGRHDAVDAEHDDLDAAQGAPATDAQDRTISNQTSLSSLAGASDIARGQLRNVSGSSGFSVATGSEASFALGSMSPEIALRTRAVDRFRARSGRANGNVRSSTATPTSGTFSFMPVIAPTFSASPLATTPLVRDELVTLPVKRDSSEESEEDHQSDRSDNRKMPRLDTASSRMSRAGSLSQPTFAEAHQGDFDYTERYGFDRVSDHGSHYSAYPAPMPVPAPAPEHDQYPQHVHQQRVIYYDPRHPPIMRALPSVDVSQPVYFSSAASSHSGSSDLGSQGPWNQYPALPMLPHMQVQPPAQPAVGLPEQWEFRPYYPQNARQ